jgi:anti-sigma factor RsiW
MTDTDRDLETLNAYVDGELSPDAHRLMSDRLAADPGLARRAESLARLKSRVHALGAETAVVQLPPAGARISPVRMAVAAAAFCLIFAGGWLGATAFSDFRTRAAAAPEIAQALALHDHWPAVVMNSSLPATRIDDFQAPELTRADLVLVSLRSDVDIAGMRAVQASYQGPHGCRLSLFRIPQSGPDQGLRITDENNVQSAVWADKSFRYIAVARRLNLTRFAVLADAMQVMTARTAGSKAPDVMAALKGAHQPCTG